MTGQREALDKAQAAVRDLKQALEELYEARERCGGTISYPTRLEALDRAIEDIATHPALALGPGR